MRLGIIPARAGSKGLPGKNIRVLAGHPLIAWTIAAARASSAIGRVVVSTDGDAIADVARRYGAEVVMRPPELASDDAPAKAAIRHVVETLVESGEAPTMVVYLQPTSPLRVAADIEATVGLLESGGFDSAASFTPAVPHPDRAFLVGDTHEASPVLGHEAVWQMRQARAPQYHLNGAVYAMDTARMLADPGPRILHGRLGAHLMPAERSVDIDTLLDFQVCELLLAGRALPNG